MHAARVASWADGPRYAETTEPPAPSADELQLCVVAAGAHNVVRSRAAGRHYSARTLPHTPGVDAVARDPATGALYYVLGFGDGFGTLVERVNVPRPGTHHGLDGQGKGKGGGILTVPLPASVVDPVAFAASVNPAMSGWMALQARAPVRPPGWTCLVLGATSASGRQAVHAAHALGAARVVGAARDAAALHAVPGLDAVVVLNGTPDYAAAAVDADVVLDYVYGETAERFLAALAAAKPAKPVQYVQIGTLSGRADVALPAALLRSTDVTIRGAGPGSCTYPALRRH